MQAELLSQVILPLALFIIMLGMGLSLRLKDFKQILNSPKAMVLGLMSQVVILPVLALLVIALCQLQGELAVGLLIISLCPGGTTSNMMSYLARGDVALSMSLTAVVSVITPFTIPVLSALGITYFMGESKSFSLPMGKTIVQLLVITIIPVVIGMFIYAKKPTWATRFEQPIKIASIIFLFVIIAGIVLSNKNSMLGFFVDAGFATLLLNVLGLGVGYGIARLGRLAQAQAVTLSIEVGIQNGTVALLITSTLLANPVMTIPAVTYSLIMFITGGIFGWLVNVMPKAST